MKRNIATGRSAPAPFARRYQACDASADLSYPRTAGTNHNACLQRSASMASQRLGGRAAARCQALARSDSFLHPLRLVHGAVQDAKARALAASTLDEFVGSELHNQLSLVHPYVGAADAGTPQGSPAWLYARSKRVTASTVAKATGLLPA